MDCFSIVVPLIMHLQNQLLKIRNVCLCWVRYMSAWNLLFIFLVPFFYYRNTYKDHVFVLAMVSAWQTFNVSCLNNSTFLNWTIRPLIHFLKHCLDWLFSLPTLKMLCIRSWYFSQMFTALIFFYKASTVHWLWLTILSYCWPSRTNTYDPGSSSTLWRVTSTV